MNLLKYKLFNKFNVMIFVVFFLGLVITSFVALDIYSFTPMGFDSEDYGISDLSKEEQEEYRLSTRDLLVTFLDFALLSIDFYAIALPILACGSVFIFSKEKKSVFMNKYLRGEKRSSVHLSTILTNSFITAFTLYLAYALFLVVGVLLTNNWGQRDILIALDMFFGIGFSDSNYFLYFLITGIENIFLFAFVFCLFTYSISLLAKKAYVAFFIPITYYFAGNFLFIYIEAINLSLNRLRPGFTVAIHGYGNFDALLLGLIPLIIPFVVSLILIAVSLTRRERCDY